MTPSSLQRRLPLSVQLFQLFGSVPAQLGWLFLLLSSYLFWPLIAQPMYENILLSGVLQETSGIVLKYESTGLEMQGKAVIAHQVRYQVAGKEYTTYAYMNAESKEPLTDVLVTYPPKHPELAKVKGMRRLAIPNSSFGLFLTVPLIATLFAGTRLYRGYKDLFVLRFGQDVWAKKIPAPAEELEKHLWAYQHADQEYSLPAPETDQESALILYLASKPERALRLNTLPGALQLLDGAITCSYAALAPLFLVLPIWVSASNIWFLSRLI